MSFAARTGTPERVGADGADGAAGVPTKAHAVNGTDTPEWNDSFPSNDDSFPSKPARGPRRPAVINGDPVSPLGPESNGDSSEPVAPAWSGSEALVPPQLNAAHMPKLSDSLSSLPPRRRLQSISSRVNLQQSITEELSMKTSGKKTKQQVHAPHAPRTQSTRHRTHRTHTCITSTQTKGARGGQCPIILCACMMHRVLHAG